MSELIAKLEAATGPDWELDNAIYQTVVDPLAIPFKEYRGMVWNGTGPDSTVVKPYTTSIDAALTLLPEGLNWSLNNKCEARVGGPVAGFTIKGGTHKYPAVALCIAILKVRADPSPAVLPQGGES